MTPSLTKFCNSVALLVALVALIGGCAQGASTGPASPPAEAGSNSLAAYQAACENAASTASTRAQADWPVALSGKVAVAADYRLTLDANRAPLPAATYVRTGQPGSVEAVLVSCRLVARLSSGDAGVTVQAPSTGEDGWIERTVNGAGLYQWSWSVTAAQPGMHHLTAQVKPVVVNTTEPTSRTIELATDFLVDGNWIQRTAWWVDRNRASAGVIVAAAGSSVVALIVGRGRVRELFKGVKWRSAKKPSPSQPN